MAKDNKHPVRVPPITGNAEEPKRKNYRLHQSKLNAAREVLGTKTETETIERALDLITFGEKLAAGTRRARGRQWNDVFGELESSGVSAEE
ncbi:MAG TPA: hypothetical protein VFI91_06310 [Longimicrobiaceae bacterium]|nr:hypothetical protein [Longimicrobiaceae bacterium]